MLGDEFVHAPTCDEDRGSEPHVSIVASLTGFWLTKCRTECLVVH